MAAWPQLVAASPLFVPVDYPPPSKSMASIEQQLKQLQDAAAGSLAVNRSHSTSSLLSLEWVVSLTTILHAAAALTWVAYDICITMRQEVCTLQLSSFPLANAA